MGNESRTCCLRTNVSKQTVFQLNITGKKAANITVQILVKEKRYTYNLQSIETVLCSKMDANSVS